VSLLFVVDVDVVVGVFFLHALSWLFVLALVFSHFRLCHVGISSSLVVLCGGLSS
jgi:hypothetical protein